MFDADPPDLSYWTDAAANRRIRGVPQPARPLRTRCGTCRSSCCRRWLVRTIASPACRSAPDDYVTKPFSPRELQPSEWAQCSGVAIPSRTGAEPVCAMEPSWSTGRRTVPRWTALI
jgi:hypothetical protein